LVGFTAMDCATHERNTRNMFMRCIPSDDEEDAINAQSTPIAQAIYYISRVLMGKRLSWSSEVTNNLPSKQLVL
jgi:hypothetical protein